jgi:S1-C subfamily serine protease
VAVRNGTGTVSNAKVVSISEKYDLAILELEKPYPKNFAITSKNFEGPVAGDDVISIGYPGIGITFEQPTITQGIISKVFDDEEGIFLTTAAINSGNSGGPIFNLNGKLVGVSFAALDKAGLFEKTGQLPTDMGYAIKSTMIKKVFKHKKGIQTKKTKYSKAAIYEKMLPSVVLVVVSIPESKWISKKPKK